MRQTVSIDQLQQQLAGLLTPAKQTQLVRQIAKQQRRQIQKRITAQQNPDDSEWEPRKPRKLRSKQGRIRKKKKLLTGFRQIKHIKISTTSQAGKIGFTKRASQIARIHQQGKEVRLGKHGPNYKYPVRQLVGISDEDITLIGELFTEIYSI